MQYGFTTAELKTPAGTRAEAFWISRTIPASLSITNNTPGMVYGAISGAVGEFIAGCATSETIKGAAMGAGIGFFTEAVAGAVTPLSIKRVVAAAAGFESRRVFGLGIEEITRTTARETKHGWRI